MQNSFLIVSQTSIIISESPARNGMTRSISSDNRNTIKIEIELNEIKSKFLCEYFTKEDGSNSYVFTNIENGEKIEVLDKN